MGGEEDPEQPFFGSPIKKKEIGICQTYAWHLHMLPLYICHTSAYTKHMHTPGALNIPDMFHISICSGEKEHENRIDI